MACDICADSIRFGDSGIRIGVSAASRSCSVSCAITQWSRFADKTQFWFMLGSTFVFVITMMPNKSPEPTAVGAVSSAIAVHIASRRWLSFFR